MCIIISIVSLNKHNKTSKMLCHYFLLSYFDNESDYTLNIDFILLDSDFFKYYGGHLGFMQIRHSSRTLIF